MTVLEVPWEQMGWDPIGTLGEQGRQTPCREPTSQWGKNASFCCSLLLLMHDVCSAPCSPSQIGHRDLDVEKRLRRDLRRTRALLADAQLLLAAPTEPGATGAAELQRLQKQVGTRAGEKAAGWAQPHR